RCPSLLAGTDRVWIPAFAGMTAEGLAAFARKDSGRRRWLAALRFLERHSPRHALAVIPASEPGSNQPQRGSLDALPCSQAPTAWIPAFAGMTVLWCPPWALHEGGAVGVFAQQRRLQLLDCPALDLAHALLGDAERLAERFER